MADKGENILVEFDYDNITLIDPNKIIDNEGNDLEGVTPMAFNTNIEEYKKWLENGIALVNKK